MKNNEEKNIKNVETVSEIDERLPPGKTILYGIQHVFVSNVWLDPIFVAAMIGLPITLASNIVNAIFIAAGLVTLIQTTKLVRLPIVQGPSAAFDAIMISAGKANALAAASGSIFISAIIVFILSITGVITRLKSLFTPVISGTVIFVVGISLASFTLTEFLGGSPGTKGFASLSTLSLSIPTAMIVVCLSLFGKGIWKSFAFLIALIIGDIIAFMIGQTNFSAVYEKDWFGLPHFLPYGAFSFDWGTFITFFIAYIVAIIEAMGVYQASADMLNVELDDKRIRNGFAGEAGGSALSSLIGGFPTTAYAQNVGVLRLTGVGSRYPVMIAGIIFLMFGFLPKTGALLALTPDAVIGGIFLPAAATLIHTGLSILGKMEKNEINFMIVGLSILLAIALPPNFQGAKGVAGTFLSNQILVGAFTAMLLQCLFIIIPNAQKRRRIRHEGRRSENFK